MAYNLRRLVESVIDHITLHHPSCDECSRLISSLEENIRGPFRTICYRCEKELNTAQIHIGNSGEIICAICKELDNYDN